MRDMSAIGYHGALGIRNIARGFCGKFGEVPKPGDFGRLRVVAERHDTIFGSSWRIFVGSHADRGTERLGDVVRVAKVRPSAVGIGPHVGRARAGSAEIEV